MHELALLGGTPVRSGDWPLWPKSDERTSWLLDKVLRSGRWAISGQYRGTECFERQFARAFAAYNGVNYCTPTTSGTAALTLAMLGLGIGPGQEVIVPGLTWVACASSVACIGAIPVLADIEPETLAISVLEARKLITERTSAIMIVHPFCRLADIKGFLALSEEFCIPLIEDCSQSHGATWNGRKVGSFGAVAAFSFQNSKVLTCGEGGAVLTNDPELYDRIEQLRSDGRRFNPQPILNKMELLEVGNVQGQNYCMSEFQAAVLLDRLEHLDEEHAVRLDNALYLDQLLSALCGVWPLAQQPSCERKCYYNYVMHTDPAQFSGLSADVIASAVSAEVNAAINPLYQPMNKHPLYSPLKSPRLPEEAKLNNKLKTSFYSLPNAQHARTTCLSFFHFMLLADEQAMSDIAMALEKVQRCADQLLNYKVAVKGFAF